jgi:predicted site-specific integrase-resolvase
MENYLTPIQLSQASKVYLDYLYRLLWNGKLKASRVNGRWQIPVEEAARFIQERKARRESVSNENA